MWLRSSANAAAIGAILGPDLSGPGMEKVYYIAALLNLDKMECSNTILPRCGIAESTCTNQGQQWND